jgi:hypothetical protein
MTPAEEKLAELNQPSLWSGINAYRSDPLIVDLTGALPRGIRDDLDNMGRYVTSPEAQELARMANQGVPQAAHPWPARRTSRCRRVPSGLACADAPFDVGWPAFLGLGSAGRCRCQGSRRTRSAPPASICRRSSRPAISAR